jgi:group I intron endonuclease
MLISGVYKITNIINNRCYIGSAIDMPNRWYLHIRSLDKGIHHSLHLQRSWNKYGKSNFNFEVLLYCCKKDLLLFEQRAIDSYKPKFNICKYAHNTLGRKHSKGSIHKIKVARKKQEENFGSPHAGKKHSEASKKKMSRSRKLFFKRPESEKTRVAIAESNRRRESEEFSTKRAEAVRAFYSNEVLSKNAREKIRVANANYIFLRDKQNHFIAKVRRK